MTITNKYRVLYSLTEINNPINSGIIFGETDADNAEDAIKNIKDHLDKYWKPDYTYEIISAELIRKDAIILSYSDLEEMSRKEISYV